MTSSSEPNSWERFQKFLAESASIKLLIIGFIILLLLIPLNLVNDLMYERSNRQFEAIEEVSNTWGREQTITGPIISVPYYKKVRTANSQEATTLEKSYFHFLPDQLNIDAQITTEQRQRGIYSITVYTTRVTLNGNFKKLAMQTSNDVDTVLWNESDIAIGITDLHNLTDLLELNYGDETLPLLPGVGNAEVISSGVSTPLALTQNDAEIPFSITLNLRGSGGLFFLPIGKETEVVMHGNWASPSFQGAFFPEHEISSEGFNARWNVNFLNRNYPQEFSGIPYGFEESRFGTSLFVPISDYQKNTRAAKYAVLIIALTFMIFFFVQILNRVRVHGIQFILIGLALCLFYVLLLSFTEHIGFNLAYLVSCVMTIGLVSLYVKAIFKNTRLSLINFLMMFIIYLFVFIIIQLEQYALLVGSIGLFIVLSTAMYFSRNITWSQSNNSPIKNKE